jgi:methylenetetrahydrofolate reductase (NADPH)
MTLGGARDRLRSVIPRLAALLSSASVEISSRGHQIAQLRDHFAAGTDVTITFLPRRPLSPQCRNRTALRRAGFNPVPHIAAREMTSREALDDFLARARGEAAVSRILLIAGDVAAARGPVQVDARRLQQRLARGAWDRVRQPGRSSRRPSYLELPEALNGLKAWRDWGRRTGTRVDLVTQFCFESTPILQWIAALDRAGIDLPVIVGLAGRRRPATLTKFALRCGIGNSMRALRAQIGRFGRPADGYRAGRRRQGIALRACGRERLRSRDFTCSRSAACARPATGCALATATRSDLSGPRCRAPGFRTRKAAPGCRPGSSCGSPHPAPTPAAGSRAARRRSGTAASHR